MISFKPTHYLVTHALADAKHWHGDQKRKYTGEPYWHHPFEVASLLARCGIEDPELLATAMLHDTLEDTECTRDHIANTYGYRVLMLVEELTEVETEGNRKERKMREALRLSRISPSAKTVKCADLISNTQDIVAGDKSFAKVYVPEKRIVLVGISADADPVIAAWAWRSLMKAEEQLK